jgi:hypothetical protein
VFTPYIVKIHRDQLSPHAFSWFIWGSSSLITFFGQLQENGGLGSYVPFQKAMFCFLVVGLSLKNYQSQRITAYDWSILTLCCLTLVIWGFTANPFYALSLNTGIMVLAYLPTFGKVYREPYQDQTRIYALLCVIYSLNMWLLETKNLTTLLFPVTALMVNIILITLIHWRRQKVCCPNS